MVPAQLFLLASACLLATRTAALATTSLAKCCPPGHILSKDSTECVPMLPGSAIHQLYVLQNSASVGFSGGLPKCDESEDVKRISFSSFKCFNKFVQMPACLEILEQATGESILTIVYCQRKNDRQAEAIDACLLQVAHVQKCCPLDMIFDRLTKTCVSWSNESQSLVTFLSNGSVDVNLVIIATQGPPTCKGPIVDYEITRDNVLLRNDTFSVIVPPFNNNFIVNETLPVNVDNACLDMMPDTVPNGRLIARVCRAPEFCDKNACIRKCCSEDMFYYNKDCNRFAMLEKPQKFHEAFASALNQTESSAFNTSNDYGLLIGKCLYGMYPIFPNETWLMTSEGYISIENDSVYQQNNYCLEIAYFNNSLAPLNGTFNKFVCYEKLAKKPATKDFRMNVALEIISCMFLLITLLVYAYLPKLQNLHGKTLMCHVSSLLLAFICLIIITWITPNTSSGFGSTFKSKEGRKTYLTTCTTLAYIMLFCFLSSFSWLNVMCFDIWWTFGILRGRKTTRTHEDRRKFLLYCLYAWSVSFLVSISAIVADNTNILPNYLRPRFGNVSCWFPKDAHSYGELIFFIGPLAVQLIANMAFFILTAVYCNKVKADIKKMTTDPADSRSKRFHSDRIRFIMNIKLFVVMGISWIFEVISFLLNKYLGDDSWHQQVFYISDMFNLLQGVLIFCLFVLKNRVYQALRKRLGLKSNEKPSNTTNTLQDVHKVRKSVSSSTLTTTFVISSVL